MVLNYHTWVCHSQPGQTLIPFICFSSQQCAQWHMPMGSRLASTTEQHRQLLLYPKRGFSGGVMRTSRFSGEFQNLFPFLLVPSQDVCIWKYGCCECYCRPVFLFLYVHQKENDWFVSERASFLLETKVLFIFPTILRHFYAARVEKVKQYVVPITIIVLPCGHHTSNLQNIIPHLDSATSNGLWCSGL